MDISTELTIYEGKIYNKLKEKSYIKWTNTLPKETRALNRLVKKGLIFTKGTKYNRDLIWTIKAPNK